jgi:hypothetical protein
VKLHEDVFDPGETADGADGVVRGRGIVGGTGLCVDAGGGSLRVTLAALRKPVARSSTHSGCVATRLLHRETGVAGADAYPMSAVGLEH